MAGSPGFYRSSQATLLGVLQVRRAKTPPGFTLPKFNMFNSEFAPEKLPFDPIGKACLPFPPFFRGELLNFGGGKSLFEMQGVT